jgi:benzodiazapine receptor
MNTATAHSRRFPSWIVYLGFVAFVVVVGGLIGTQSLPGAWYESLNKPPFNPPNWVFGPVWTALYVMIGLAGARIFLAAPRSLAMGAWVVQMALNFIWSPVWFNLQMIWPAFVVIVGIWLAIVAFIVWSRPIDKLAAWLFVPYLAWVSFATILNLSIGLLN